MLYSKKGFYFFFKTLAYYTIKIRDITFLHMSVYLSDIFFYYYNFFKSQFSFDAYKNFKFFDDLFGEYTFILFVIYSDQELINLLRIHK